MAAKSEYFINGRAFHIERNGGEWIGWFHDDATHAYAAPLKIDALRKAGYLPHGSGVIFVNGIAQHGLYAPRRTMQHAYEEFRHRIASGHFPRFWRHRLLHKFVIFARDGCCCIYCGRTPELSIETALDHVIPCTAGGSTTASNLVFCCIACNSRKLNRRHPDEQLICSEIRRRNQVYGISDDHQVAMADRSTM